MLSDPLSEEATSFNKAAILGTRLSGSGRATLDTITAWLGMPPPLTSAAYAVYNRELGDVSGMVASNKMVEAANELHCIEGKPVDEVIDAIVTLDGTWQKRGHSSLFGVIVVISWKTGKILDFEVLSKHCTSCSVRESMDMDTGEFAEWYEKHRPFCQADHKGSSGSMEVVGTERIWKLSVAKNKLRYTTIISDGDSKAFNNIVMTKPYGPDIKFIKHECVGHVQKHMYYALTTLKKSVVFNEKGERVKFGGRLTDTSIKGY